MTNGKFHRPEQPNQIQLVSCFFLVFLPPVENMFFAAQGDSCLLEELFYLLHPSSSPFLRWLKKFHTGQQSSTTIQICNSTATSNHSPTTNTATAEKVMTIKFNKKIKSTIYNKTDQKSQTKPTKTQQIPLTPMVLIRMN